MLLIAAGATLVTAWEIFDAFRHARRSPRRAEPIANLEQSQG
jgi:hypothetical protein